MATVDYWQQHVSALKNLGQDVNTVRIMQTPVYPLTIRSPNNCLEKNVIAYTFEADTKFSSQAAAIYGCSFNDVNRCDNSNLSLKSAQVADDDS